MFVDFTKMERITVAKTDIISHLYSNNEIRNIFGLKYDFGQIWDLIQLENASDKKLAQSENEVKQRNLFKK